MLTQRTSWAADGCSIPCGSALGSTLRSRARQSCSAAAAAVDGWCSAVLMWQAARCKGSAGAVCCRSCNPDICNSICSGQLRMATGWTWLSACSMKDAGFNVHLAFGASTGRRHMVSRNSRPATAPGADLPVSTKEVVVLFASSSAVCSVLSRPSACGEQHVCRVHMPSFNREAPIPSNQAVCLIASPQCRA